MTVKFYGSALEYVGAEKAVELETCKNIEVLIEVLGRRYGNEFEEALRSGEKWFILVNGSGIAHSGGLKTPLQLNDRIDILPFVEAG